MKKNLIRKLTKIAALLLAIVLSVPTHVFVAAEEQTSTIKYGDVDVNGTIDAADALEVLKHAAKLETLGEDVLESADVNGDDVIDAVDALEILKYAAKLIDKFPVEEMDVVITEAPTEEITPEPSEDATPEPTEVITIEPTVEPTATPTVEPTATPTVEPTATPTVEPTATPTVEPTATPTPEPTVDPRLNPITYDEELKTYTMHGQNAFPEAENANTLYLSNAEYQIENPFIGLDMKEPLTLNEEGYPVWTKGVTISFRVFLPEDAIDAEILTFKLSGYRQVQKDDYVKYLTCQAYTPEDETYSMGTSEIYIAKAEDGTEVEYTVLSGYGSNVRYNPDYPSEGLYAVDADKGTIDAYKKGADPSLETSWTKIKLIGTGYYEGYSKRFEEEGGEKSKIREADIQGSLNLYASGSVVFQQDDQTAIQLNPNADKYGEACPMFNPSFFYHGNGTTVSWNPTNILKPDTPTPVMAAKGKWHFVVVTIQNDWIQFWMDGKKLEPMKDINMNGAWFSLSTLRKSLKEFNLGYGYRDFWTTKTPNQPNSFGMLLTDFISNPDTTLYVGGAGVAANRAGMNHIGTPDGTKVKDLTFYEGVVEDQYVTEFNIHNMTPIK